MKKNILLFLICCLGWFGAKAQTRPVTLFDTIMNRVCEREYGWLTAPRISQPKFNVQLPDADGSYKDINLRINHQVSWIPIQHLQRLRQLAIAFTCPQSERYKDPVLYKGICNGLQHWADVHPISTNWWWQQIGVPHSLGPILILMRQGPQPLPEELESVLLKRLATDGGNPAKWTGANKMDIALHWLYQACLLGDKQKLEFAVQQAYQPIALSTKEGGPQHDYSFHQHGDQLYIGGYGDVFIYDLANVAFLVHGTAYAPTLSQLRLLHRFIFESALPVIRGRYRLYNVQGRSFTRQGGIDMGDSIQNIARLMKDVDLPQYKADYEAAIARLLEKVPASHGVKPYHRHYWRSDYTLHQRPQYTIDVRLKSVFSCGNENGNGENLKGYFLSDGGMDIATDGDEYKELFPVWDWSMIPGVTAPQLPKIPTYRQWGAFGTSTFAGGTDDGVCGVTAYRYNDTNAAVQTSAHKSWLFFDKAVVCLGAGITSHSDAEVRTTVNQCRLKGEVRHDLETKASDAEHWVWHRGVGYYFPAGQNMQCSTQKRQGTWSDLNISQSKDTVSDDVFQLYLSHGLRPQNASYAYTLVPGEQQDILKTGRRFRILQNDTCIQAVREGKEGALGIVFYKAGTLRADGCDITTDRPCVLWLKPEGKSWTVCTADPSHRLTEMSLSVKLPKTGLHRLHYTFRPTPDAYAGATVKTVLTARTPTQVQAQFDATPWQYDK